MQGFPFGNRGREPKGALHVKPHDETAEAREAAQGRAHAASPTDDPEGAVASSGAVPRSAPEQAHEGRSEEEGQEADEAPPEPAGLPRFERAQLLAVANQKGGVGKTTTAVSLAAALADLGCRVLLVDLDPQGNATSGVGLQVQTDQPTIYDVLVRGEHVRDAIVTTDVANLSVVPSTVDLAGAEVELVSAFSRELQLRQALEPVHGEFDVILIDCPPSLGLLTVNALSAADAGLIPIQCEYYALEGLGALRRNAELVRAQLNPNLAILGFVLTMLDARTRLSQQVVEEVRSHFGERVFASRIPRTIRLAEAPGFGQPITAFDPTSRGAIAYRRLAVEVLDRLVEESDVVHATSWQKTEGEPA